jgi:hypothetical protein
MEAVEPYDFRQNLTDHYAPFFVPMDRHMYNALNDVTSCGALNICRSIGTEKARRFVKSRMVPWLPYQPPTGTKSVA